jgi:hypothetical protein
MRIPRYVETFLLGWMTAFFLVMLGYAFAFEAMIPPRLTCAVRSADGCMVWQHPERVERYKAGRATQ